MTRNKRPGYQPCGCYVDANAAVIIRCSDHGAIQWHDGGKSAPSIHPWACNHTGWIGLPDCPHCK